MLRKVLLGLLLGSVAYGVTMATLIALRASKAELGTAPWDPTPWIYPAASNWTLTPPPPLPPPVHIKVGPYMYTVKFGKSTWLMGETAVDNRIIWISTEYPVTQERETMLHEVMHACSDIGSHPKSNGFPSEDVAIESMAPTLLQVLQDNPELVKWLASAKNEDAVSKPTVKSPDSVTTTPKGSMDPLTPIWSPN